MTPDTSGPVAATNPLRIAVAAEYRKLADSIEKGEKQVFLDEHPVGDRSIVESDEIDPETGRPFVIGAVSIPKTPKPTPVARIVDESVVLAWAMDRFGADVIEEIPAMVRLTEQGKASAKAAALSGDDVPGVEVATPSAKAPYVTWKAEKDAPRLLASMAARGVLDLRTVLELPAGGQQ